MANPLSRAWDFIFRRSGEAPLTPAQVKEGAKKNLNLIIPPYQLERIRQNIFEWRDSIREAELAWYPQRVKMQRMYQDTVINGHVKACMERRKDLTLLRDFKICNANGEEDKKWTEFFKKPWFNLWVEYGLDALAYGYQLIAHGDIVNDGFPNLDIVKRENVSPDRLLVSRYAYSNNDGISFLEEPYLDYHTYFKTPTENGASICGYGYLYSVAYYEILLRGLTGANADFVQYFGMPFVKGFTEKTEEAERAEFADALAAIGTNKWIMLDKDSDNVEALDTSKSGAGYESFDNFDTRCLKMITKIILGHADALDSTPGKLGSEQGDDNPIAKALKAKKTRDGAYIENAFNDVLLPKLRNLGFNIPEGLKGCFSNDEEEEETRRREDDNNQKTAAIMKTISDAGGQPDWKYFSDRTGIIVENKEVVEPAIDEEVDGSLALMEKVNNLYRK